MYVLVVKILAYIQFLFLLIGTPLESLEKIGDFSSPDFLSHYVSHRRPKALDSKLNFWYILENL